MYINNYSNNLNIIKKEIQKTIETINNDGLEQNVDNLKVELLNNDFQRMKNGEIENIDEVINSYNYYDTTYSNMKNLLTDFKSLMIRKENETSDKESINIELNSIIDSFDSLFNTSINGEKLFNDEEKHSGIGKDLIVTRIFDKDTLNYKNEKITDFLKKQIDSPNLEEVDNVFDLVNLRQVEVGSKQNYLNNIKDVYIKQKNISQNNFEDRKDLTKAIIDLNSLKITYEAFAKTLMTLNEMSLVKYI